MNKPILLAIQSNLAWSPIEYTFDVLLTQVAHPLKKIAYRPGDTLPDGMVISYGKNLPRLNPLGHIHIQACSLFESGVYLSLASLPGPPVWLSGTPYPYSPQPVDRIVTSGKPVSILPDILAGAFFLLSSYQEFILGGPLDQRGRFEAEQSWLGKHKLLHRPLVNEYQSLLLEQLKQIFPTIKVWQPEWRGKSFSIALSHDIDSLQKFSPPSLRSLVRSVLLKQGRAGLNKLYSSLKVHWLGHPDSHNNIEQILDWEDARGIRASFYWMSSNLVGDSNYELNSSHSHILERIQTGGWESGFHPGFRTTTDNRAFKEELARANLVIGPLYGGRQHALRFRPPYTWRLWRDAGFRYDSSLGYADHEGFRCGYCFPFQPFDLLENKRIRLWELPLVVMDDTLKNYRGLNSQQAAQVLVELLETVRQYGGVMTILWHNSYFGNENAPEFHSVFAEFLQSSLIAGAYIGTSIDMIANWENKIETR